MRQWIPGYGELGRNVICYKELEVSMVQTWIGTCYSRQLIWIRGYKMSGATV